MIRLTALIENEGQSPLALSHESNALSVLLGRDPSADFQIPLATVSRHHARISESDGVYVLEDMGSVHGTSLNDTKIQKGEKKVLRDGDVLQISKAKITVSIEKTRLASVAPEDTTQVAAVKAIKGILGRLGESQQDGPFLRILSGPGEGNKLPLTGAVSQWTVGRVQGCEWVLQDNNVSRKHFTVRKDWQGFTVEDAGSKNGTLLNSKPLLKPTRLQDKDEIHVGPIKILFVDPDAELLSALKHVPGFAASEPAQEVLQEHASSSGFSVGQEPSVSGLNPNLEQSEELFYDDALPPVPQPPQASEDHEDFSHIEDALLEEPPKGIPWGLLGLGLTVLALLGAVAIVWVQKYG